MSGLLVWIDENLFLSYAIFVLLIIPLIQKIDSTSKIYYIGKNKGFGFTKSAAYGFVISIIILLVYIFLKWNSYIS